ncbi:hypothetical protein ABT126_43775 [Streptomyces sp. NPDC002012]
MRAQSAQFPQREKRDGQRRPDQTGTESYRFQATQETLFTAPK